MAKFQQDLTSGHVGKQLIAFSIPFLFSNLVQSVYNVADMLIVAGLSRFRYLGGKHRREITFVILGLVFGLSVGGTYWSDSISAQKCIRTPSVQWNSFTFSGFSPL